MEKKLMGSLLSLAYVDEKEKVDFILDNLKYKFLGKECKKLLGVIKQNFSKNKVLLHDDLKISLEKNKLEEFCQSILIDTEYDNELYKEYLDHVKNNYITNRIDAIKKYDDKQKVMMIKELADDISNFEEKKIETLNMKSMCLDYVSHLDEKEERLYTKNWTDFNELIRIVKEDLVIIAGRPAMGKSAYSLSLCLEFAKAGFSGCFFSLEMANRQVYKRMLSQTAKVHLRSLDSDKYKLISEAEQSRVSSGMEELNRYSDVLEVASGNFSIEDIDVYVESIMQNRKIDYIIVDYLQLIVSKNKGNRETVVAEISMGLKRIAMKYKISVIALAQLSRGVENRDDKVPKLSDLRESGQIEQDASIIIMLYREYYYNEDEKYKHTLQAHVPKNRNGELGVITHGCYLQYQSIVQDPKGVKCIN